MLRSTQSRVGLLVALAVVIVAPAFADVTDTNGIQMQIRRFNDYGGSNLSITPAPPGPTSTPQTYPIAGLQDVSILEQQYGAGGFANQHVGRLSADGGVTARAFQNSEAFDISFDIQLDAGAVSPRKEAGFRIDTFIGGEGFFIITSDGECAAFGGPLPFHTFGGSAYILGDTVNLRMVYTPDDDPIATLGDASTIEYFLNGVSSGVKEFGNLENGIINGTDVGFYGQFQPDDAFSGDFAVLNISNIAVNVPEPASLALLALLAGFAARRR